MCILNMYTHRHKHSDLRNKTGQLPLKNISLYFALSRFIYLAILHSNRPADRTLTYAPGIVLDPFLC